MPSGWFAPLHTTVDVIDSQRFFKGFKLADDPWLWTQVDLMTYPFHVYAMIGEAENGYDELNVGVGYLLDLVETLKLRLGFEWNNVDVILSLPLKINEHCTLTGILEYNEPLAATDFIEDQTLSGGVPLRFEF